MARRAPPASVLLHRSRQKPRARASTAAMRTEDVLALLGDAASAGRVRALRGDLRGRVDVHIARAREILQSDVARVDASALSALKAGVEAHDAATDDESRWAAMREAYDTAQRALLNAANDPDLALADVTHVGSETAKDDAFVERKMTFDGENGGGAGRWRSLNDGVMGGASSGTLSTTDDGRCMFSGNVSLDYNGGFASVRAYVEEVGEDFDGVYIDAKSPTGEAKTFLFILKDEPCLLEQTNFKVKFKVGTEFTRVKIPFAAFCRAERMGRVVLRPPLKIDAIREFGLMILKGSPSRSGRLNSR